MEKLTLRICAFAGIIIAAGLVFHATASASGPARTENFLESVAPDTVDGAGFQPSAEDPKQSYKMDKATYDTLKPYGIVCRRYNVGRSGVDAVLIASREKDSFHDPHLCFRAQGMVSVDERVVPVETKTRGTVPVRFAKFHNDWGKDNYTAYFYSGPYGYKDSPNGLKLDILKYQLVNGRNPDAVFYRFMADQDSLSQAQFLKFIADYVDAANASSHGYF